jgi:hypothetical protein
MNRQCFPRPDFRSFRRAGVCLRPGWVQRPPVTTRRCGRENDDAGARHQRDLPRPGRRPGRRRLHRSFGSALRWTAFTLCDRPKNGNWFKAVGMALIGIPWVLRRREPMSRQLDDELRVLDRLHFAARRTVWSVREDVRRDMSGWPRG